MTGLFSFLKSAVGNPHTDILARDCQLGRPESKTNIFVPSPSSLADRSRLRRLGALLVVEEDVWLLLEGALALDCQFGRHDCGGEQSVGLARNRVGAFDV